MRSVKQLAEDMHVFLDVAPLVVFADGKETPWFCEIFPGYMHIQELVQLQRRHIATTRPRSPFHMKDGATLGQLG